MENMPEFNSDRREFFRLNDSAFIEISIISDKELTDRIATINSPDLHNTNPVQHQLHKINTSITHTISKVNQSDRDTARALRLLDSKLDLITRSLQQQEKELERKEPTDINLSGNGIALLSAEHYADKSALEIQLGLYQSGLTINAIANVVSCEKLASASKEHPYYLRLVFSYMKEHDRNALVKHVLSRQAQQIQELI